MNNIWILIANASNASIYSTDNLRDKKLALIAEFDHPESRMKAADLVTDQPGHYQGSDSKRGTYQAHTSPKESEIERFAIELAHKLEHARADNDYAKLLIVAPAHFQGILKKHLSNTTQDKIEYTFEKDYTKLPQRELIEQLHQQLGY